MTARFKGLDEGGWRTVYGVNPVRECFRAGRQVERLYLRRGAKRLRKEVEERGRAGAVELVESRDLERICGSPQHQGVAAKVAALKNASLNHLVRTRGPDLLVLMLDGVQDPHNLGAVLRVADGAGVDLVITPSRDSASVQLGSVAKASAGAVEHVPVLIVGDLKRCLGELAEHGFQTLALEAGEGHALDEVTFRFPVCVVLGGEGRGVRERHRAACTGAAHVPLSGRVNSLNVSVTAGIAAFTAARHRPGKGAGGDAP